MLLPSGLVVPMIVIYSGPLPLVDSWKEATMDWRMECFLVIVGMPALHSYRPHMLILKQDQRNVSMRLIKQPAALLSGPLVCLNGGFMSFTLKLEWFQIGSALL